MLIGILCKCLASEEVKSLKLASGTTQLDSFVPESGGLTGEAASSNRIRR